MSMWTAIKRAGAVIKKALKKCFSQPTQEEINEIPLIEEEIDEERQARGQSIADATFKKIITFLSAAGAMQYTILIVSKVYFSCSEERKQDKDCIADINLVGSVWAYAFALTITLIQLSYGRLPSAKRNLGIFLDVFFKFPFIFQLASYAVGALETPTDDSLPPSQAATISNTAQWVITISYSVLALAIAVTASNSIRQKIKNRCCGSRAETELTARDFRRNVTLDGRSWTDLTEINMDVGYNIFGNISDIRGLVAGGQNMLAALLCKPRSIFFSAAAARWVPAVIFAFSQMPFAVINHPLKPIEFRSWFERKIAKLKQLADLGFFCMSLLVYIVAAFKCDEDKILPAVKLAVYIVTIMGIYGYDYCSSYLASQDGDQAHRRPTLPAVAPAPEEASLRASSGEVPINYGSVSEQSSAKERSTTSPASETGQQAKISAGKKIPVVNDNENKNGTSPAGACQNVGLFKRRKNESPTIMTEELLMTDKHHGAASSFSF